MKQRHAHRLLQCLVAAIRPLRVEELAQILTIKWDTDDAYNLVDNWRPEDPEKEVLSACSTLISVIDDKDGKIVQFSHLSVKDFLTSDLLRKSDLINDFHYYISLDDAHATFTRACLTVLLQLDESTNKTRLARFPLAFYAARHWVDHAKFGDVTPWKKGAMERLFEPKKPYFGAWIWMHDLDNWWSKEQAMNDLAEHPSPSEATPLYYAALCGFIGLAKYLIVTHGQDVNAKCGFHRSPLGAASHQGHVGVALLLLGHGADVNLKYGHGPTPLRSAYDGGRVEVMRLLLGRRADVDTHHGNAMGTLLHDASSDGQEEIVQSLLQHCADVNARGEMNRTPLHFATVRGHTKVVRLLLEHSANVNAKDEFFDTPLDDARRKQRHDIEQLLLEHDAESGRGLE
jgi:Ankyrin repeats (3 copies)